MKKHILLSLLIIFGIADTQAQIGKKQLPALKDSIIRYYQTDKKTGDPVNEFLKTFELFFTNYNLTLSAALKQEELRTKLSYREVVSAFYDSLYNYFIHVVLQGEIEAAEQNLKTYSVLTTQYYCDCVNQSANAQVKNEAFGELMQQCSNTMGNDNNFMQKIGQAVSLKMLTDKNEIVKISSISLVAGCKPVTDYFYTSIKNIFIEEFILEGENRAFNIVDSLNALLPGDVKKTKELFPDYKKFTGDRTKINGLINTEEVAQKSDTKNNENGTVTVVYTYYRSHQKQIILLGQAEYLLNKRSPFAVVLSCKYVDPGKIKDPDQIIKSIKDMDFILPPPPAMDELREIKIDTKKEGK